MKKHFYLSPVMLGLIMTMSTSSNAAESVSLSTIPFTQLKQAFQFDLPGIVNTQQRLRDSLQFVSQHQDAQHISHVRIQQHYLGFPVFGGYGILHSKASFATLLQDKQAVNMTGKIFRGLETELGQPDASFLERGALALEQFKATYKQDLISEEQVMPMVYIDEMQRAFWAYKISFRVTPQDGIPMQPTAIVDAKTSAPFIEWDDIKTIHSIVNGKGYGGNQHIGLYQYGVDLPFLMMSRDDKTGLCYLENKQVRVVDMNQDYYASSTPVQFACYTNATDYWTGYLGDGYDQINGAYSPSNDALYTGTMIHQMYYDWYGIHVLMQKNNPKLLVMRVHYGKGYENAFWDGKQMTFGDGDRQMHPLVSLSVGAHEISHGFTEQHADLNYVGQSGGMNESFSDMAAQAAEYYAKGESSWTIGSEIIKNGSGYNALRYMDKPSRDGQSIDSASQYRKGMNVHFSSGVYNRLFYLLANQSGWNVRTAFHVMLKANMDYWTPYSTFDEGACGVLRATRDLNLSEMDVKRSLDDVAINYQNC